MACFFVSNAKLVGYDIKRCENLNLFHKNLVLEKDLLV